MIKSILLSISILLISTSLMANEVICTPTIPKQLDPHQAQFPVEEYLSSLAYKSLFGSDSQKEGVVETATSSDEITWKLKIRKNLKFNTIDGWKPGRPLDSSDVAFSINRQLASGARTQLDVKTFNNVKFNGLERKLLAVKVSSPDEVILQFKTKTTREELNKYLAPPVGYVLSKEFFDHKAKLGQNINFYPPSTDLVFTDLSINLISLVPVSEVVKPLKKGTYVFKGLRTQDTNLKTVKEMSCRRVYFGGKSLTDDLTKNNRRFRKQIVSRTKVFLQLNSNLNNSSAELLELRWLINPEKLTSLKEMEISKGLFNKSSAFVFAGKQSAPLSKEHLIVKDLVYCEIPHLAGKTTNVVNELKKILTRTLNYKVHPVFTRACEILPVYSDSATSLGTINSFTYKSNGELLQAFSCDSLTRKPFGFCVSGANPQEKEVEAEALKFKRVFPLLDFENYFIYIF